MSLVVDVVVCVLVLASAYLAMVRGFVRELFALASWVLAFFAAFFFAPSLQPVIAELPGVGGFLEECLTSMVVAFIVVFGIVLIVSGVIIWMFSGSAGDGPTAIVDQGLGFIYGALRGVVLVAVMFITYEVLVQPTERFAFVEEAMTIDIVRDAADVVRDLLPEDELPGWLESRVAQLRGECGPEL